MWAGMEIFAAFQVSRYFPAASVITTVRFMRSSYAMWSSLMAKLLVDCEPSRSQHHLANSSNTISKTENPRIILYFQKDRWENRLLACLWGPLRMCARAPSHAVLMASIEGVPNRSVIKSSYTKEQRHLFNLLQSSNKEQTNNTVCH